MLKKLILFTILLILSISAFSDFELDNLLKDDEDIYSDLTSEESGLVPKEAYVEELFGQIFLQYEGADKWLQITKNSIIKEKDTVLTMENSSVKIRIEEETYINLSAKSKIYFDTMAGKPEVEVLTEVGLKLAWGKVFSNVRKKLETGGRYEIEAGSVVAGVRGTQFEVESQKNGEVKVKVFEGRVFVMPIELYNQQKNEKLNSSKNSQNSENKTEETENQETEKQAEQDNIEDDSEENKDNNVSEIEVESQNFEEEQTAEINDQITLTDLTKEIILYSEDEFDIDDDGLIGELTTHNDSAPTELIETSEVSEEIKSVTQEVVNINGNLQNSQNEEKKETNVENNDDEETEEEAVNEEITEEEIISENIDEEILKENIPEGKIPEETDTLDTIEETVEEVVEEVVEENTSIGKLMINLK